MIFSDIYFTHPQPRIIIPPEIGVSMQGLVKKTFVYLVSVTHVSSVMSCLTTGMLFEQLKPLYDSTIPLSVTTF